MLNLPAYNLPQIQKGGLQCIGVPLHSSPGRYKHHLDSVFKLLEGQCHGTPSPLPAAWPFKDRHCSLRHSLCVASLARNGWHGQGMDIFDSPGGNNRLCQCSETTKP